MLACSSAAVDGDLSEISPQTFGAKYNDCAGSWQKVNDLSSDLLLTGRCTRVNTRVGQMDGHTKLPYRYRAPLVRM